MRDPSSAAACQGEDLASCEKALVHAISSGDPIAALTRGYASARRDADSDDGFAATLDAAIAVKQTGAAALGVELGATAPKTDLARFDAHAFAPVAGADPALLYFAIAETAGLDELAIATKGGTLYRAFGADPFLPLVAGLPAVVVGAAPGALEAEAALEKNLRLASAHAGALDLVAASHDVDAIDALMSARPEFDGATVRARAFLAAIDLSEPKPLFFGDAGPAPPPPPEPSPSDTPYLDLLRVRTDRTTAHAYEKRRAHILTALDPELAGSLDALYGTAADPCASGLPPKFTRPRDLAFVSLLPRGLRAARTRDPAVRAPLEEWYATYGAATQLIEKTHTAWLYAPTLLFERGASAGIVPTGSDTHRRVTALALAYEHALVKVAEERPGRIGLTYLGFLVARGHYDDPPLRSAALDLARLIAQGMLSNTTDAWQVLVATIATAFYGSALPAELAETHYTALQGAFTAKLRGDLSTQTGWGVATAFALDGAYRAIADLAPSPKRTVTEIARALESDPKIAQPGLAALASALVRYGALSADGQLGTPILGPNDVPLPGRAEARASLEHALSMLADDGAPPKAALDDLVSLLDGGAATVALATLGKDEAAKPKAKPAAGAAPLCATEEATPMDPRVRRAVGKLADLRRKVWTSPGLNDGSAFGARARLAVLLASDAIDVAQAAAADQAKKSDASDSPLDALPRTKFFVPQAEANATLTKALATYGLAGDEAALIDSTYTMTRGFFTSGRDYLDGKGRLTGKALLSSLAGVLEDGSGTLGASELLRALARSLSDPASKGSTPVFVSVARDLYAKDQPIEADMVLLSAAAIASVTDSGVPEEAIELATSRKSDVAAVIAFLRETERMFDKGEFHPERFTPGLTEIAKRKCAYSSVSGIVDAYSAIAQWKAGDHDGGRAALDAWLDHAASDLSVPRYSFQFKQETRTRGVSLTLEVGLGRGLLSATNSLQAGAVAKSSGEPTLSLDVTVASADSKRTRDDTARFYISAAATAAVYHFMSGDDEKAEVDAMRAISAATRRTELFVPDVSESPIASASDAAPILAVAGELAAERGRPLLAGSLFSVVRASQPAETTTATDLEDLADRSTPSIDGTDGIKPVFARTKKTLHDLAAGLPCGGRKLDRAALLTTTCESYPRALGLRVADSVAGLPRLKPGPRGETSACPDLAALDAFFAPMQEGRYEPDRLVLASRTLLDAGKTFDATILLTQQRDSGHCSRDVLAMLHDAASRLKGVPALRADVLGAAVNCGRGAISAELLADLDGFATEITRLGDPVRELELALFTADLALSSDDARPIAIVARRDGFIARSRESGPVLLGIALVLDHVASALAHDPIRIAETRTDYELLCGTNPRDDRAELCGIVASLRSDTGAAEERAKTAKAALQKLLTIPK